VIAQQHSDWTDRQRLGELIKTTVFDLKLLDPKDYDKERITALKQLVNQFLGVDDNLFFTVFRRSASEFTLSKDLEAVKLHQIHQGQPAKNQVSTAHLQILSSHRKQGMLPRAQRKSL
jgi:hypothetical protein